MGWVLNVTPRLPYPGKDPVRIVQVAGWAPVPVWKVQKISSPPGFDPRTVQPVASRYTDCAIRAHHVAVCSLCNSLYPADQAATVVEPKVTESIKSGVYGFGNTKNRQQPFIRPSGFSHTDKHGCEGNTYTA